MPVYMIRAGENGPVKIGHSDDPETRLVNLQTAHYEILRIMRLFEGGQREEATLHLMFADIAIVGEWHAFSRRMLGDVGLVEIITPDPSAVPFPVLAKDRVSSLRRYLNENRIGVAQFGVLIGVSAMAVHRYLTGERRPRAAIMDKITAVTNGAVRANDFFGSIQSSEDDAA